MEQHLNNLISYIRQSASLCIPNPPTLTPSELRYLFSIVDVKRKKYLDLNEVYELIGDVTEKEMFCLFKWMDGQKRGVVTIEDLQRILGTNQHSRSSKLDKNHVFTIFYQRVDAMKDKFKELDSLKDKYGFNQAIIVSLYNYLLLSSKPNQMTVEFLNSFLSQRAKRFNLDWNASCEAELKQIAKGSTTLSLETFTEIFGVQSQSQFQEKSFNDHREKIDQFAQNIREKYGLNKAWTSDPRPKSSQIPTFKEGLAKPQAEYEFHRWESQKYPMQRKLSRNNDKNESSNRQSIEKKYQKNPETSIQSKQFAFGEQNIDQALRNIEKRRQELRRDSIERKKLIEEVMHRKKQANGLNVDSQENWEQKLSSLNNYAKYSSISSNLKKSSVNKSYLTQSNQVKPSLQESDDLLKEGYIADKMQRFNKWQQQIRNQKRYTDPRWDSAQEEIDFARLDKSRNQRIESRDQIKAKKDNYNLEDILNKYKLGNAPEPAKSFLKEYDESKLMMRSTSGLLNPSNKPLIYPVSNIPTVEFLHSPSTDSLFNRSVTPMSSSVSKYPRSNILGSKENLMRRAEDEASRKIEEIERKARMKVMEKKAMMTRWGK